MCGVIINMLTKAKLFKKYNYKSWSIVNSDMPSNLRNNFIINKKTEATDWHIFNTKVYEASKEGNGYKVNFYKKYPGVKSVKI